MAVKEQLIEIFKSRPAGPFLFVGSGFSRRYLNLEDWRGLLERFCVTGQPFEYYLSIANGDYPKVAQLLAEDFNRHWWSAPEYAASVERNKTKIKGETSALRIEISNYLSTLDQSKAKSSPYAKEVELLAKLNVDGVITTNWDLFLEQIFPDYKIYTGQEELLFSNPQEIGEIYKIHGCSTQPESLILTNKDYTQFHEKNAYLAAKLITLFVEHPIVFIGYSISDENISSLLRAISLCIGKDNIEQLRKNLIFVQRLSEGEAPNISDTYLTIDGVQIPLVLVKCNDFIPIYEAIDATKRKIPARVLRYCKEQLYELVKSAEPEKKICVVDIDEIDKKEDIEFLVGVGVAAKAAQEITEFGYQPITAIDLFCDLFHNKKSYDPEQILRNTIKSAGKNSKNVPIFKYFREYGIENIEDYRRLKLDLDKWAVRDIKEFRSKTYAGAYFRKYRHSTIDEIIKNCTPENAAAYIPFLTKEKIDTKTLLEFLIEHEEKLEHANSSYASNFRKLAAFYDRLKWGW